ncbi:MAG: DUF2834 domain-containing protein [Opitutaceae bacterium]
MNQNSNTPHSPLINLPGKLSLAALAVAVIAFLGPNGLYLYFSLTQPELNSAALRNPIALAFITEAFLLVAIFLGWVYHLTHSWSRVAIYFVLTMCGSLAFSFPLFLYRNSRNG